MGAAIGCMFIFGALALAVAAVDASWWVLTLCKYALYRALKVGTMPMREYFAHYRKQFDREWGF